MTRELTSKGKRKQDKTYTPMTDSFFGGSLLMMKTGDRLIKGLRGDVGWSGKEWYERMEVGGGLTFENLCSGKGFQEDRA